MVIVESELIVWVRALKGSKNGANKENMVL
jgi:hypothetical protein